MSGPYLEKLEHFSMLHKNKADLSPHMETLQQDLTDITQKPSSFFASLTPVEFLSMIHYQTAIMCHSIPQFLMCSVTKYR
jgi:hypothetical protein